MTQPNPEQEPVPTMDTVVGADTRNALGGEPHCVIASRVDDRGLVTLMHVHSGEITCPLAAFVDLPGTLLHRDDFPPEAGV